MIQTFLDKINQNIYEEILVLSNNFNENLMQLENILNELDASSYTNYNSDGKSLHLLNQKIIDDFEKNTFSKIFKVTHIEEVEIIKDP